MAEHLKAVVKVGVTMKVVKMEVEDKIKQMTAQVTEQAVTECK